MDIPLVVVTLLGMVLSGTSLLYIVINKKSQTTHQIACLHLMVADFTFALLGLIEGLKPRLLNKSLGIPVMKIITAINLLAIVPVGIDRVVAVRKPLTYGLKLHRTTMLTLYACCWIIPCIYTFIVTAVNFAKSEMETALFKFLPTMVNIVSYGLVLKGLNKTSIRYRSQIITVIKSIFITLFFTVSWIPPTIEMHEPMHNPPPSTAFLFFMNTITDSLFYMIPNAYIRKAIQRVKLVSERSITQNQSQKYAGANIGPEEQPETIEGAASNKVIVNQVCMNDIIPEENKS